MARAGIIIERILTVLQAQAETTATLLDVAFSDYYTSYRKLRRGQSLRFKTDWASSYRNSQAFYSLLNHMKREGLILKKKVGRSSSWKVTSYGLKKLRVLTRQKYRRGIENKKIGGEQDATWKMIIFDVPEIERHKRVWLRSVLMGMGFTMRQKSVWMGKKKIPTEFLEELREKRLMQYVDILAITRSGTLKDILK